MPILTRVSVSYSNVVEQSVTYCAEYDNVTQGVLLSFFSFFFSFPSVFLALFPQSTSTVVNVVISIAVTIMIVQHCIRAFP